MNVSILFALYSIAGVTIDKFPDYGHHDGVPTLDPDSRITGFHVQALTVRYIQLGAKQTYFKSYCFALHTTRHWDEHNVVTCSHRQWQYSVLPELHRKRPLFLDPCKC